MGHDDMPVADNNLKVHEIEGLRIADASIIARAGQILKAAHGL
ncbi:GMC oxidoreductase [Mycobacterium sp. 2YAF39]